MVYSKTQLKSNGDEANSKDLDKYLCNWVNISTLTS